MQSTLLPILTAAILSTGALWAAEVPYGHKDFYPSDERPIGWQGDDSGRFPGASPVTDYDPAGANVAWSQPLPTWGNASPIVAGKLVISTAEPDLVLAHDALTGAPVWQADSAWTEGLPADKATAAVAALGAVANAEGKDAEKAAQNALKPFSIRPPFDYHAFGFSMPTPASDGERIYVKCATGTV